MSNTTVPISEWCREIRVALARKEMNLQSVADEIGYSYTTITALISGRIVKDNYLDIAKKINEVLEVNVLPEKPQLPSDEWCGAVRAKLYVKKMNISELSKSIGFNRDKKIKGGKERLVLPNGEVVAGERCKAKEADGYGYISHFATCPGYRR